MAIKATIHKINKEDKTAVVSLVDEGHTWIDRQNTYIELNPDGSANTEWFNQYVKFTVCGFRLNHIDKVEEDLL